MRPTASDGGYDAELVAHLFAEALERPAADRRAFLDSRCSGSPALRAELGSLIAAHDQSAETGSFLGQVDRERGAALLAHAEAAEDLTRRVGPYRLKGELGRGGMGAVYLAERAEGGFAQRVAIKLVKRGMDSDAILQRFVRERQILAGLEHPNVARLLDGGVTDDGQPYFAMELVDGELLTEYCHSRRLGLPERLQLFEEACRAVQYAHGRLVIHRDLKPSNMLVTEEGHLKLLDFGVAKVLAGGEQDSTLTETGTHPRTLLYAAPEQVGGEPVTTATDVYALGLVLYELVSGRLPYGAEESSRDELERAVRETAPAPPSRAAVVPMARSLRGDLDAVVLKALRKEPARRYGSAEALAEDIRRLLTGQPVQARPDSVGYRTAKFIRRHKLGVGATAAGAISLVIGLLGTTWQAAVAARERDRSRVEAERAEQVKEFLVGVFRASDPAESKGQEITARDLLERGTERIEKELSDQPAVQAELLRAMSGSFRGLGRYDRARALQERSLELLRKAHGPEHPLVAGGLASLAGIMSSLGDYAAAESLHRESLAMRRRLLPAEDPEVADSMDRLASLLTTRAKLVEAEALIQEALAIRQKRLGPEHRDTISSLKSLANLRHAQGDYAAAIELERAAVRGLRKLSGDLHPEVAESLSSLGAALLKQGDVKGAEAAHREALGLRRQLFGDDHPSVTMSLHHLAATLHSKGDLAEAESLYRQALAADRRLLGDHHPKVAVALGNLGSALAEQAKYAEAMPLFDQAIAIHRRGSGAEHPRLARALERKAAALILQARPGEALPLLEECLAIHKARPGSAQPGLASTLFEMGKARAALQQLHEAERLFREALDARSQTLPKAHYATIATLVNLGEVLIRQGRASVAEPLLREARQQAQQALPAGHWRNGEVESVLGACLLRLGKREEALALLGAGHHRLQETFGDEHPTTARAWRRLADARSALASHEDRVQ